MTDDELDRLIGEAGEFTAAQLRGLRAVVREAAAAERQGWAAYFENLANEYFDTNRDVWIRLKMVAARIREGGAA